MMVRSRLLVLLSCAASLALLPACKRGSGLTLSSPDGLESVTLTVEVADTFEEQSEALSGRTAISGSGGILFVYDEAQVPGLSMEGVLIPLTVLYFDPIGKFVAADEMETCAEYNQFCREHIPPEIIQYALFVSPGFRERHGVRYGWMLDREEVEGMRDN